MDKSHEENSGEKQGEFVDQIGEDIARKLRARTADNNIWHGLGSIGTVGWTVGLPTLLGVLLGAWLDSIWPGSPISWTLALLIAGLATGLVSAWLWMEQQRKDMGLDGRPENDEEDFDE
jgi:ATP synthase protein I